jgi:hypothetical protein
MRAVNASAEGVGQIPGMMNPAEITAVSVPD